MKSLRRLYHVLRGRCEYYGECPYVLKEGHVCNNTFETSFCGMNRDFEERMKNLGDGEVLPDGLDYGFLFYPSKEYEGT